MPQPEITTARVAVARLAALADEKAAETSRRYFKTGPGGYAEGDRFRGIRVPLLRNIARACAGMSLGETVKLLRSPYHEDRLVALIVMGRAYDRDDDAAKARIVQAYIANLGYVNNWDLVDTSAPYILGPHVFRGSRAKLHALARSRDVWKRRVAIIATQYFIRQGESEETVRIATTLLADEHDLIHKAVGWMLREVGQRCDASVLRAFLDAHAAHMPRTMLRYAIEHFSTAERAHYMGLARQRT
jgi:3-methyladenine DNA glycosylase AlkD